jgi:transposase
MREPIYVRPLTKAEREQIKAGLRSSDGFVLRRCQILLASERGERATAIGRNVGCDDETVRNILKAFNERGLKVLKVGSRRPHHTQAAFSPEQAEKLKGLLHQSPRTYGKATSVWTLDLVAEVSFDNELTKARVSDETVRATLERLGVKWARAKRWITSPDPEYARKKSDEID